MENLGKKLIFSTKSFSYSGLQWALRESTGEVEFHNRELRPPRIRVTKPWNFNDSEQVIYKAAAKLAKNMSPSV